MPRFLGEMKDACLENLSSNPTAGTTGRLFRNTTDGHVYVDNGSAQKAILFNDGKCVFGTSTTASNNIRLHRGSSSLLQFVAGNDTTAELTLSTTLAQVSARVENSTSTTKPAAGNSGRMLWLSDQGKMVVDNGTTYQDVTYAPLAPPACILQCGTAGVAAFAGTVTIPFFVQTTNSWTNMDNRSAWDGTNNWYLIPENGLYVVGCNVNVYASPSAGVTLSIPLALTVALTNGFGTSAIATVQSPDASTANKNSSQGYDNTVWANCLFYFSAGDKVFFQINQGSGQTTQIRNSSAFIYKISNT